MTTVVADIHGPVPLWRRRQLFRGHVINAVEAGGKIPVGQDLLRKHIKFSFHPLYYSPTTTNSIETLPFWRTIQLATNAVSRHLTTCGFKTSALHIWRKPTIEVRSQQSHIKPIPFFPKYLGPLFYVADQDTLTLF